MLGVNDFEISVNCRKILLEFVLSNGDSVEMFSFLSLLLADCGTIVSFIFFGLCLLVISSTIVW